VVGAFSRAARRGRFRAVRFERFWASMDTLKERMALEEMHRSGNRPRAVWGREARTMADHAASSSSLRFPCDWPGPQCKEDR
jgi:NDP-sugar pyrophosphorylase family protein